MSKFKGKSLPLPIHKFYVRNGKKEIWDIFFEQQKDLEFYERVNAQIDGTVEYELSKNPYLDYDEVYKQKRSNSIQGAILEFLIKRALNWKWATGEYSKWLDLEDSNGRIWEIKSISRWTNGDAEKELNNLKKLFFNIIDISKRDYSERIYRWILGEFDRDYELVKITAFDLNGILEYLDNEISKFEKEDIPI